MKTVTKLTVLVTGLFLSLITSVYAQNNPALSYYQAFLLSPEISESEQDYLASNNLWSVTLPTQFGVLTARYDAEFEFLRQAARSKTPCDWGIDMAKGPSTLLPHLARCKAAMIGARYRVAWDLQNGRPEQARDDLLAAFVLARNISRDGTLISVLVQIAAECIGSDVIAENYGKFDPKILQQIVDGLDAAPARGSVAASIGFEKISYHDWILNKVLELQRATPGDEPTIMAGIHGLLAPIDETPEEAKGESTRLWETLSQAGGHTSEGIVRVLREEDVSYDRLARVMALPFSDFDAQAKSFATELDQTQNPLLAQVVGACVKARQREFKVQVWTAMLHAALQYRLAGEAGLLTVKDPCGPGPFAFQRFLFDGVDRGLRLESAFHGSGFPEVMIFVEKKGPPFLLDGPHAGEPRVQAPPAR